MRIIVPVYDRLHAIKRLCNSLLDSDGVHESGTDIVFSLDHGFSEEVYSYLQHFEWHAGKKEIIEQSDHLGVDAHVRLLLRNIAEDGDALILEDDTFVDTAFMSQLKWMQRISDRLGDVVAISLYSYPIHETYRIPFHPLRTESLVYAMAKVSSRGLFITKDQAKAYFDWEEAGFPEDFALLPAYMRKWSDEVWEKRFNLYLMLTGQYVLFPVDSTVTGFGDTGVHFSGGLHRHIPQTVLNLLDPGHWQKVISDKDEVPYYDAYYELIPSFYVNRVQGLAAFRDKFDVDLYGSKPQGILTKPYTLTSCFKKGTGFERSYALDLDPPELNILKELDGNDIRLILADERSVNGQKRRMIRYRFLLYSKTYRRLSDLFRLKVARILDQFTG